MPRADETPAIKSATAKPRRSQAFELPEGDGWFADADDHPDKIRILYFGREGSTKTTSGASMANSCPDGSRILVVNAEGGLKTKPLRDLGINTSRLSLYPDPRNSDHTFGTAELNAVFTRMAADLHQDPHKWYGTMWDSTSRIVSNLLDESQADRVRRLKDRERKAGRSAADVNEFFTDRDDYGVMSKKVRSLLHKFMALPTHWVGTALVRREVDEDTRKPMYGPSVNPALWETLLGDPDIVIAMVGEDELGPPRGLTQGNTRYRAKDRFHCLPRVMSEPTFERVLAYYNGDLVEEEDEKQQELTSAALASFDAPKKGSAPADDDDEEDEDE